MKRLLILIIICGINFNFCAENSTLSIISEGLFLNEESLPEDSIISVSHSEYAPSRNYGILNKWKEVNAIIDCYGDYIQNLELINRDIIFTINNIRIYHHDGKMLSESNLKNAESFNSIFYNYPGTQLDAENYSSWNLLPKSPDFLNALIGSNNSEVDDQNTWVPFFDHAAYINKICSESLISVENEIIKASKTNQEVKNFINNINIIYSYKRRKISGGQSMSYHSYGLALDLEPNSYKEKAVFWKWTRVFNKCWHLIPEEKRWSPPEEVIKAFEDNGFIWGGHWTMYDNIHFEYRPEIIEYNNTRTDKLFPDFNKIIKINNRP